MNKILFFLFLCSAISLAQETEVTYNRLAEDYFLLGMRQYSSKEYSFAVRSFHASIEAYPMNHRITASIIMKAKSLYALKNYQESAALCDSFLLQFPGSEYIEDALFTRGMCSYNMGEFRSAAVMMEQVYTISHRRLNTEHSLKVIEHIATEFLREEEFDSLAASAHSDTVKHLLQIIHAERAFSNGNTGKAASILDAVAPLLADQELKHRLQRLRLRIDRGNNVSVGIILPLMANNPGDTREKKIASEILDGVQFAVADYEDRIEPGQVSVDIDVRDSERSSEKVLAIIDSLSQQSSTVAVIGPVFSDETMAAAAAAVKYGIPLISPTATDDSVALQGDYVFQANSTSGVRGKILAQYAVKVLGAEKIAILSSNVPFAATVADSFAAEVVRLGGSIVLDERYQRGEADLRNHFRAIRSVAANLSAEYSVTFRGKMNRADVTGRMISYGFTAHFVDSVIARSATVNLSHFIGNKAKELADSLKLPMKKNMPFVDSLHYPVSSIDLLFSPITGSQQIGIVSSQVAYYNIKALLLGTSEWNNIHELDLNRRYAEGVIFGSERWVEQDDRTHMLFARFSQKYNRPMSDNALFGYDVMSLLITVMNDGALTREHMIAALSGVVNYPGIRNSITLRYGRVNSDLNILQYKDGVITKLQTATYQP